MMLEQHWEVFFITQRPATRGETVQRQTQRWLVAQGFDLPSVLVIAGSRGAAAGALRLDYHVDDLAQNCVDVLSDLGTPDPDRAARRERRQLERPASWELAWPLRSTNASRFSARHRRPSRDPGILRPVRCP